jgi:uroporphyrinogen-III decarboxylase
MDELQARFGYVIGDVNTDGLLNAAYHLYGQNLFADFYDAPERAGRIMNIIGDLIADVASYFQSRTSSFSISVNRQVSHLTPTPFLHANCSVQMISPKSYRTMQLPIEQKMAERMQPFGIHHCGDNLHLIAGEYAKLNPSFVDVGWGSYVAQVRQKLPNAFLNLRLSPVRMLECSPQEIAQDAETLLREARSLENIGVCCINMDAGTPDENIFAMYEVVEKYRKASA